MAGPRRLDRRVWLALAAAAGVSLVWLALTLWWVALSLDTSTRQAVWTLAGDRLALVGLAWLLGMLGIAWALRRAFTSWVTPLGQLAEEARVLLRTDVVRELRPKGSPEARAIAGLINELVSQREALRRDIDSKVQETARHIEQEKSRLAALISELTQSVVVCNLDGRILLYNNRARLQFRAMSQAPTLADGAELIGLGRSIYTAFDRQLVAHALDSVQHRLQRGVAHPTAQFVTTTRAGQFLRVQMAPVREVATSASDTETRLAGFVLMLDNLTKEFEQEAERERLLLALTEGSRSSLATIQASLDMLDGPDAESASRHRLLAVVKDEVSQLTQRIEQLTRDAGDALVTRWSMEDMLGADLVSAATRRIEQTLDLRVREEGVDTRLWLRIESFTLLQCLVYLAARLKDEFLVRFVGLRLTPASTGPDQVHLDLVWQGLSVSTETVMSWEMDPMRVGDTLSALSVREVVERHAGAFWFERERAAQRCFFRFLLPSARPQEAIQSAAFVRNDSRPEYYDFDLFRATPQTQALDDARLADLAYTVFDTETTGLNPAQGDEIIQMGATRIVNGKLLKQESFDQLVDPKRPIPEASIPIHGITPDMVKGRPTILEVLPAFHAFAQDTVLVAHNAAFDMRFLQLKEKATGLVFDQPVLDTLLLSAVVHPQQDSHRLEAIAERFNVRVIGRHTALGDAMVTAEVFLKLVPLLAERGIHTLGQARAAAQTTYYARLKY